MDFNIWAASRTLKGKLANAEGLRIARRLNPSLTDEEWRQAIAEARAILADKTSELSRPLNRRPVAGEYLPFRVKNPNGWIQQVEVYVRDLDTGVIEARPWSYKTETLRSRMNVIKEALNSFRASIADNPEKYREEVLTAGYTGTYQQVLRD